MPDSLFDFLHIHLFIYCAFYHLISNNLLTGFSRDVFAFLQPHTEQETENREPNGMAQLPRRPLSFASRRRRPKTAARIHPLALALSLVSQGLSVCVCICERDGVSVAGSVCVCVGDASARA